ncbi:MAG: hypothetical protein AUH92_00200 [Acidobacteria bacterium 13_1_40CM_4_69_4]|nr:MAG: hypothetical protein AUH92_00200 [Acidobacteria bacterium 13_1_40CM_4_69_4]
MLQARAHDAVERLFASRVPWILLFFLALIPLAVGPRLAPEPPALPAGSVAPSDVVAAETREFIDEAATHEVRETARQSVHPIYDFDSGALEDAAVSVRSTIESWRASSAPASRGRAPARVDGVRSSAAAPQARRALSFLATVSFDPAVEDHLVRALQSAYRHRIVGSRVLLPGAGRVTLRDPRAGREWDEEAPASALSLDEARLLALRALRASGARPAEVDALGGFLQDLVAPTMVFDGALTESRRQEAATRIEPLIVRIPKGKVLVRRGESVGPDTARTLSGYLESGSSWYSVQGILGGVLFLVLPLFLMSRYVAPQQRTQRREHHLFSLMVLVTVIALVVDRGFLWLFDHVVDSLSVPPYATPAFYRFMVPVAAGAMLMTLLAGPLFGTMVRWDVPLLIFCVISNLTAIFGVTGYRKRTALIKAGLVLGAVNAAAVLALRGLPGQAAPASDLVFQMACGFGGGVLVAVLASFLLPLLESMFNILTDVRLLELSNLNNPLLRRLAVEAPGSYNHSVVVGTLAEAAAEAIGANALFCRVAAYYHDVGKMLKPNYFIENQREGDNRHDRLSPHMSALVISSHVKEGYELAKSYGLPQEVLDIIPQHHGTRKINYFYQKALHSGPGISGEVQESDFRYPGPKPQTREAAIFMLSDSIEAAARTLEDPSPARFKGLIRKIVSDIVLDDQLNESDLTFSGLEKAEAAFLRTLSSIYHHRIDYPGFDFEKVPERSFRGSRAHEDPPPTFKRWGR